MPDVEPAGIERDRLGRLDDRRPVVEEQPARRPGPAERVLDPRLVPRAAASRVDRVERPLAAVGERQRVAADAGEPEPLAQRVRGGGRVQDALEASRAREHAHARDPPRAAAPRSASASASSSSEIRRSDAKEMPSRARKTSPTPTPTDISIACRPMPKANPWA